MFIYRRIRLNMNYWNSVLHDNT